VIRDSLNGYKNVNKEEDSYSIEISIALANKYG
jgi:hypothetical protein